MLEIAICDDEAAQTRQLAELLQKYMCLRPDLEGQLHFFDSSRDLLIQAEACGGYDLYILDIIMPEPNGIEAGLHLKELNRSSEIIYLTGSRDYAVESYRVCAFQYLLKPVEMVRFFEVLDAAAEKIRNTGRHRRSAVLISTKNGPRRILLNDILYAERIKRFVRYYCTNGSVDSLSLRIPFRQAVEPLTADTRFCRCGSSFAFNFQHVTGIENQTVLLDTGQSVTIPRASVSSFRQAWAKFWLEAETEC